MRHPIRTGLLIGLCGGIVLQTSCATSLVTTLVELGANVLIETLVSAITTSLTGTTQ